MRGALRGSPILKDIVASFLVFGLLSSCLYDSSTSGPSLRSQLSSFRRPVLGYVLILKKMVASFLNLGMFLRASAPNLEMPTEVSFTEERLPAAAARCQGERVFAGNGSMILRKIVASFLDLGVLS
jgi:hypothetical protein